MPAFGGKKKKKGSTGHETAGQGSGTGASSGQTITNTGGTGGGGGGTGGGTDTGAQGSAVVTGGGGAGGDGSGSLSNSATTKFGKSFAPTAYPTAWENPEAVIRQWFNSKGLATDTGYEAMAQELQPSLGIQFLAANNQPGVTSADLDTSHYLDYVGKALDQGGKAGGNSLGAIAVLSALLDPQNDVLKSHLANSSLKPADQVTNELSALRYGLSPSLPTPVLNALLEQVNSAGKDYQAGMLTNPGGQANNFSEVLRGLGLM